MHLAGIAEPAKWEWIVTGLPGLGKTCWIPYAISQLFQQAHIQSVFVQVESGQTWELNRYP